MDEDLLFCPMLSSYRVTQFLTGHGLGYPSVTWEMGISALSDISFANIFSHSVDCVFEGWHKSVIFFVVQENFLVYLGSIFKILLLIPLPCKGNPKNIIPTYVKECSVYVLFQEFYDFQP